jgi:hypothetical protein
MERAEAVARIGPHPHRGGIERAGEAHGRVGVDVEQMHVGERVDEQPAPETGGVAADLPALEVEGSRDIVVVEIAVDEAAEHPEHQDVVGGEETPPAEVEPHLEVGALEVLVEVVTESLAEGVDALAVVAVERVA